METKTIDTANLFRTWDAAAKAEWSSLTKSLEQHLRWVAEDNGVTASDARSITRREPSEIRDCLIEAGEFYLANAFLSREFVEYLAYSLWDGLSDTPFHGFIKDAESIEEREEWTARAVLWCLTLWYAIDTVLLEFLDAIVWSDDATVDYFRSEWHLG